MTNEQKQNWLAVIVVASTLFMAYSLYEFYGVIVLFIIVFSLRLLMKIIFDIYNRNN